MKNFSDSSLPLFKDKIDASPMGENCALYVTLDNHLFFAENGLPVCWLFEKGEVNITFKHCNDMGKYLAICFEDNCWRIYDKNTHNVCFFTTNKGEKVYVFRLKAHYGSKIFIVYNGDKNEGWFDTENLTETTKT